MIREEWIYIVMERKILLPSGELAEESKLSYLFVVHYWARAFAPYSVMLGEHGLYLKYWNGLVSWATFDGTEDRASLIHQHI